MSVPVVTRLGAVCVTVAALTASTNASAHYYALLKNNNIPTDDADDGSFIDIRTTILHSTCTLFLEDFVNHEMWYGTVAGGTYWVEVGFKDGINYYGNCVEDALFWADFRNGGGYNEHYPPYSWSFGTWYSLEVVGAGYSDWSVNVSGVNVGTSTSNWPGEGRALNAGIETTSQTTGSAKGDFTEWWEMNSLAQWVQGWDGPTISSDGQPFIEFINSGTETDEVLNESF